MIEYDINDHYDYLSERSLYLCTLAGLEPEFVTKDNYNSIREALYLTVSGVTLRKALIELSIVLYFSILTTGENHD